MSNFGYTDLRLVNPYDVAFREAKSAVKAGYILEQAQVFDTVAAAVADCAVVAGSTSAENRDLHLPLHRLEAAGEIVRAAIGAAEQKAGLLFGSEKFGLSNEDMSYCQWLFRIPTRSEHGSMNLGQAVAVTLYELRRKGETATQRFEEMPRASGAEFERIVSSLHRLLSDCGYVEGTAERRGRRFDCACWCSGWGLMQGMRGLGRGFCGRSSGRWIRGRGEGHRR